MKNNILNFVYKIIVFVLLFLILNCSNNILINRPSIKDIQSKLSLPYGSETTNIYFDGFYVNNTILENDKDYYTYISFKPNGLLIFLTATSMSPDTLAIYLDIWNPKLTKDGIPKDIHNDFGFFKTNQDSVFSVVNKVEGMGTWDYYNIFGKIIKCVEPRRGVALQNFVELRIINN